MTVKMYQEAEELEQHLAKWNHEPLYSHEDDHDSWSGSSKHVDSSFSN